MTDLNSTPAHLAQLVRDHGDYQFEGFVWLKCQIEPLAEHLGKSVNTVRKIIGSPPFRYITRKTDEDGKHILLKVGADPCETDHVNILRGIWVPGVVRFNAKLAMALRAKIEELKDTNGSEEQISRLSSRLKAAEKGAARLPDLNAGKKIPLAVERRTMGLLRGFVQTFGADAPDVLRQLIKSDGWDYFTAALKAEERTTRFYHWPTLGEITRNPDIALEIYLSIKQESGDISIPDSTAILAKIAVFREAQNAIKSCDATTVDH